MMKKILFSIVIVVAISSCADEPVSRKEIVDACVTYVQEIGNVDEELATKYCKCSADTLITIFSRDDLESHMKLSNKEKYELYLPYNLHCMEKLANDNPIQAD